MKKFVALLMVVAVCFSLYACQKSDTDVETTKEAYSALSQDTSEETIEKAMKAYASYIAPFSGEGDGEYEGITNALVVDLDKNKIPEVIFTYYGEHNMYILSYGESDGLSIVSPVLHSSSPAEVYYSEDNSILYYTDSGHNQGTSWVHEGVCLKATSEGFETLGTVSGDTWDGISADIWENEDLFLETDEEYDEAFEISINKFIGNGNYVNFFDVCEKENAEKYLEEKLSADFAAKKSEYSEFKDTAISLLEDEPISIRVNDFDRNGTYEAFVLTGKTISDEVQGDYHDGTVWFISDEGKVKSLGDYDCWSDGEVLECQYNSYYQINLAAGSSSPSALWKVSEGDCEEIKTFKENGVDKFEMLSINAHSNSVIAAVNAFDATVEDLKNPELGTGHTYKPYFYYDSPNGIREYGGIEITESQLDSLGGSIYVDLIKDGGYTVKNIYARENGIININFYKHDGESFYDCNYINLRIMNNGVSAISDDLFAMEAPDDIDEIICNGFYTAASVTEIATYPDKEDFAISPENNKTDDSKEIMAAYRRLLEDIRTNSQKYYDAGVWGDEDNSFAIGDITNDGIPELLVAFESTSINEMKMTVWTYKNGETHVYTECGVYDVFYEGGYIQSDAYHNHTKGETIWPFTIDKYNLETGEIDSDFYSFYCRDEGYMDSEDDPFPVADDKDNDGVIYYISDLSTDNLEGKASTKSEYEAFINKYIPEKNEIKMEYSKLTAENIKKVK